MTYRINSPTLAAMAVFGETGWVRGRTGHPIRLWRGVEVDIHLKDEWLDELNSIPDIEIRATCEGHREDGLRPTYVVFRLMPEQDHKAESVAEALRNEGVCSLADIGAEQRPRIVAAAGLAYGDAGWEDFWRELPNRIRRAVWAAHACADNPGNPGNPSQIKIDVRFGELLEPQDLIRIDSAVRELADTVTGLAEEEAVFKLYDYVCREISYPPSPPGLAPDHHVIYAFPRLDLPFFGLKYVVKRSTDEFFQYPSETLAWRCGDCDDCAILLTALLRAYGIEPERVAVVIGQIPAGPHSWVQLDGTILETTLTSAPALLWRTYPEYVPAWAFNDIMVSGEIVFVPKGDERSSSSPRAMRGRSWHG
ncbi:MAG: transglutaminase domain-containing protein [Deltaproteobacteria bacterium]|nr:transglutaminase domain-containing protein [Deltaproteobacteria bacterium]